MTVIIYSFNKTAGHIWSALSKLPQQYTHFISILLQLSYTSGFLSSNIYEFIFKSCAPGGVKGELPSLLASGFAVHANDSGQGRLNSSQGSEPV